MARRFHRPRHVLSPRWIVLLKLVGFRYSISRDAYILRLVGNHLGPVFKERQRELASRVHSHA